ncbi:hypothetical protein O3Q49_01595 [Enterococcus lactis]
MEADFIWLFSIDERRGATDASDRYFESQCYHCEIRGRGVGVDQKGIGFGRKIGDPINERDVESVYQKI